MVKKARMAKTVILCGDELELNNELLTGKRGYNMGCNGKEKK